MPGTNPAPQLWPPHPQSRWKATSSLALGPAGAGLLPGDAPGEYRAQEPGQGQVCQLGSLLGIPGALLFPFIL